MRRRPSRCGVRRVPTNWHSLRPRVGESGRRDCRHSRSSTPCWMRSTRRRLLATGTCPHPARATSRGSRSVNRFSTATRSDRLAARPFWSTGFRPQTSQHLTPTSSARLNSWPSSTSQTNGGMCGHDADVRDHCFVTKVLSLRRTDDGPRALSSGLRPQRRYELHFPNGEYRVVNLHQMDTILNGRSFPADFWAVVNAADAAFAAGERDALTEWPSGRRADPA